MGYRNPPHVSEKRLRNNPIFAKGIVEIRNNDKLIKKRKATIYYEHPDKTGRLLVRHENLNYKLETIDNILFIDINEKLI